MSTRFKRPSNPAVYTPIMPDNTDIYQQDKNNGVAIASQKVDNDFNNIIDKLNEIDDDLNSIVAEGLPAQTGNANKSLTTNGTSAGWSFIGSGNMAGTASRLFATNTSGDGAEVAVDSSLQLTDTTLGIKDGGVTTAKIQNNTVTTSKLVDGNVTTAKLADNNITLAKLAAGTANRLVGYAAGGTPTEFTGGTGVTLTGGAVAVDIADQAEAEAGADNTKVMTPLRTKQAIEANSPAAKIVAAGNFIGSSAAANAASNISLTRNTTGDYSATFTTAEPDTNYIVNITVAGSGITELVVNMNRAGNAGREAPTTNGFRFAVVNNGGNTLSDPDEIYLTVYRIV